MSASVRRNQLRCGRLMIQFSHTRLLCCQCFRRRRVRLNSKRTTTKVKHARTHAQPTLTTLTNIATYTCIHTTIHAMCALEHFRQFRFVAERRKKLSAKILTTYNRVPVIVEKAHKHAPAISKSKFVRSSLCVRACRLTRTFLTLL